MQDDDTLAQGRKGAVRTAIVLAIVAIGIFVAFIWTTAQQQ